MAVNLRAANWTAAAGVVAMVAIAAFGAVVWVISTVDEGIRKTTALVREQATFADTARANLDKRIVTLEVQHVGDMAIVDRLVLQVDKLHEIEADLNIAVNRLNDLRERTRPK